MPVTIKDPSTAQGMSDGFRDAELLVAAIDDGFGWAQTASSRGVGGLRNAPQRWVAADA